MKKLLFIALTLLIVGCKQKEEKKSFEYAPSTGKTVEKATPAKEKASFEDIVDLENKGIGPVTSVEIKEAIDQDLAKKGENYFKINCMACHKTDRKFIGPALGDITAKRSPEWIMNMTMNTAQMVKKDPLAKGIYEEYDKAPMVTAPVSEENARAILEYLRSLNP
ncbi:c-type cytochrome [Formosa undariae]|uniref:C-type cytochrome n=1 Tax=Formosa undariae TaxID=1325436 RepID=A0ABV5F677_9FLAO